MDCYYSKFYPRREYLLQNIQNKQTNTWDTFVHSYHTSYISKRIHTAFPGYFTKNKKELLYNNSLQYFKAFI